MTNKETTVTYNKRKDVPAHTFIC